MALDKATLSAIEDERKKFSDRMREEERACCGPIPDSGAKKQIEEISIKAAVNGFTVSPGWPAEKFLAGNLDDALAIGRAFLEPVSLKQKTNLKKNK